MRLPFAAFLLSLAFAQSRTPKSATLDARAGESTQPFAFSRVAAKPQVEIRYETLCPFCKRYISKQLPLALQAFAPGAFGLSLLPYGNVREIDGELECQHGKEECALNIVHACALDSLSAAEGAKFVICMETDGGAVETCAPSASQAEQIQQCAEGPEGRELWAKIGALTTAADYEYVPWVTLNGKHSEAAEKDLVQALCSAGLSSSACEGGSGGSGGSLKKGAASHLRLLDESRSPPPPHSSRY